MVFDNNPGMIHINVSFSEQSLAKLWVSVAGI